jgi:ketosteroid isomerase-like protein
MSTAPTDPGQVATRLYEAWNEGGVEAVAEDYWAPEIEWRDDPWIPDPGVWKGREAVRKHIEERVELLGRFEIRVEEVLNLDGGRVLVIYTFEGQGPQSGAPYSMRMAQLLAVVDQKVTEVQDYLDLERAFAELGIKTGP